MKPIRHMLWLTVAGALTACGAPPPGGELSAQRLEQVTQSVARGENQVSVEQLAQWIIESRKDFMLIDIRSADAFAAGHIKGAQNLPLTDLVTPAKLGSLPKDRKVILYSTGSEHAAAASALLRLAGCDALLVKGGYDAWSRHVLNPDIPSVAEIGEAASIAKKRAVACYFVGGQGAEAPVYAPKPAPFVPPVTTVQPKQPRRAHREGC